MVSVILLMAGSGTRMKQNKNKILLPVKGKPIFTYPLNLFLKYNFEIICVIKKEDEEFIKPYLPSNVKITYGGKERKDSVLNGLNLATGDYVLIHDSARAFIDSNTIDKILELKNNDEAILSYLNVKDTIKENVDGKYLTLDRSKLIAASTPQCASLKNFKYVYNKAKEDNYMSTDDISLIERYLPNIKINYVLANEESFKITTPLDYELAKIIGEKND